MSICEVVHVYEFLPSRRKTELCHYYQHFYDAACTLGAYHPLLYEKNLVKRMNLGSDQDIYNLGRVTLPGFSTFNCTPSTAHWEAGSCRRSDAVTEAYSSAVFLAPSLPATQSDSCFSLWTWEVSLQPQSHLQRNKAVAVTFAHAAGVSSRITQLHAVAPTACWLVSLLQAGCGSHDLGAFQHFAPTLHYSLCFLRNVHRFHTVINRL